MNWFDYTEHYGEWREDFDQREERVQCEGCGGNIPPGEQCRNDWSDTLCSGCRDKMYCAYCGALVDKAQKDESGEYCCDRCRESPAGDTSGSVASAFEPASLVPGIPGYPITILQ